MTVTAAYELDIPEPYADFFLHGEKAVSVAPTIDGADPRTNYHMAIWTDMEGGEYLLRIVAENASSWATSVTQGNARVIFYSKRGVGPHEATIYLPRGRQRIDLILSNLSLSPGPCYIAFSLHRQGRLVYTSNAIGWVFNVNAPIADSEIPQRPDPRVAMNVWTLLPNWADGIIERVTYETEILSSESTAEQRRSLRYMPRRSFEVSFLRSNDRRTRIDSMIAALGKNTFLLPMWHEHYVLQEILGDELTFPAATLIFREFRIGMFCLLNDKDPNLWEVVRIEEVHLDTDTIEFEHTPELTWGPGTRIWPLRVARILDQSTLENLTDAVGQTTVRFQLDDIETNWFDPAWGSVFQLFQFKPNRSTTIPVTFDRPTAYVTENAYGPVEVYDTDQVGNAAMRGALFFRGRQKLQGFRQFIDVTRGRAVSFWIPSFTTDFVAIDLVDGDKLIVKSIGFSLFFKTIQKFRSALQIEFHDDTATAYRFIDDAIDLDEYTEQITLSEELSFFNLASVRRISYLIVVRFDQDAFEFKHEVDGSAAVTTSFVVKTVLDDLALPGAHVAGTFTSLLYPLEVIEGFDTGSLLLNAHVIPEEVSELDIYSTLVDGTLAEVVEPLEADPESLDVSSILLEGTLDEVVKLLEADPESLNIVSTLVDGTLYEALISLVDPSGDEEINVTSTLLGGTLG